MKKSILAVLGLTACIVTALIRVKHHIVQQRPFLVKQDNDNLRWEANKMGKFGVIIRKATVLQSIQIICLIFFCTIFVNGCRSTPRVDLWRFELIHDKSVDELLKSIQGSFYLPLTRSGKEYKQIFRVTFSGKSGTITDMMNIDNTSTVVSYGHKRSEYVFRLPQKISIKKATKGVEKRFEADTLIINFNGDLSYRGISVELKSGPYNLKYRNASVNYFSQNIQAATIVNVKENIIKDVKFLNSIHVLTESNSQNQQNSKIEKQQVAYANANSGRRCWNKKSFTIPAKENVSFDVNIPQSLRNDSSSSWVVPSQIEGTLYLIAGGKQTFNDEPFYQTYPASRIDQYSTNHLYQSVY